MSLFSSTDSESARKAIRAITLFKSLGYVSQNQSCSDFLESLAENRVDNQGTTLNEDDIEHLRVLLDCFSSKEMAAVFSRRDIQKNPHPCQACVQHKVKVS